MSIPFGTNIQGPPEGSLDDVPGDVLFADWAPVP